MARKQARSDLFTTYSSQHGSTKQGPASYARDPYPYSSDESGHTHSNIDKAGCSSVGESEVDSSFLTCGQRCTPDSPVGNAGSKAWAQLAVRTSTTAPPQPFPMPTIPRPTSMLPHRLRLLRHAEERPGANPTFATIDHLDLSTSLPWRIIAGELTGAGDQHAHLDSYLPHATPVTYSTSFPFTCTSERGTFSKPLTIAVHDTSPACMEATWKDLAAEPSLNRSSYHSLATTCYCCARSSQSVAAPCLPG